MALSCMICKEFMENSEIIVLKCSHSFCWKCIEEYLKENLSYKPKCPLSTCSNLIKDSNVRRVLSEDDIKRYEDLCLKHVENAHKCLLPECDFMTVSNYTSFQYECQKCSIFNCIMCQLAHRGLSCGAAVLQSGRAVCEQEVTRARGVLKAKMVVWNRQRIVNFETEVLVPNSEIFNCDICMKCIGKGEGITLRQCFHKICRDCLMEHVKSCQIIPVTCPFASCEMCLEDRECRGILSESDTTIFELKSLSRTCNIREKTERCRQANCNYMCDVDNKVKNWKCKICGSLNCVKCNAIHKDQSCRQYMNTKTNLSKDEMHIEALIRDKKLMRCPKCKMIIEKVSGCNWIKCSSCQTELCWINQTFRWGPKGKGDVSGGCKCGLNGIMCHPDCHGCIAHGECPIM